MRTLTLSLLGLVAVQALLAAPGDRYMPGRLSVRFLDHPAVEGAAGGLGDPGFDAILRDFPMQGIEPLYKHLKRVTVPDLSLNYVLTFDGDTDMETVAALFEATGKVEYAEPDYMMPVSRTPNDPSIGSQWTMDRVEAYEAWDLIPEVVPANEDMIIAIIDSGMDWNHPDLIDNIWVNPGEDLDGDGVIPTSSTPGEADERNGLDDDGNGFVDDFYGWDWVVTQGCANGEDCATPDNNPMDFDGHGTHCSGIAAATTDNGVGVASISWSARIMCLRAGYHATDGGGYVIQTAAAEGLYYAIENGAKIVSMSFGGSGTLRTPATVAYNSGVLCFHAAGNDNITDQDQLDRATGMISVASTSQNDCKSDFSNYGEWIDVCAPGSAIFSTIFNNDYASLYGTSMACPNAASLTALIWWMNPELSQAEVRDRLIGTTDDIYSLGCNAEYASLLGSGRINARKALLDIRETTMSLAGVSIDPVDGDGRALPGDTLAVRYTIANLGYNATGTIQLSVQTDDDQIEILTPNLELPVLPDGATYTDAEFPMLLRVSDGADPHYFELSLTAESDNAPSVALNAAEIMIGLPTILLYDDSEGEADLVTYWTEAMKANNWIFDWYSAQTASFPDLPGATLDMDDYAWTVYASGQNASTLDEAEQALFTDYLSDPLVGHDLLVSGQHIDEDIAGTDFFAQTLNAGVGEGVSTTKRVYGVHGDLAGTSMILLGAGGANNQDVPVSEIVPLEGAEALFLDNSQTYCTGLIAGWGENRVVYCNFALEAASGASTSLDTGEMLATLVPVYLLNGVSVEENGPVRPAGSRLAGVWPNPFNPTTTVAFELARAGRVQLTVYNLLGQPVATLVDGPLAAGEHRSVFDAGSLPSGLYLARLAVDGQGAGVEKLMLVR